MANFFLESLRGKSLVRMLMNEALSNLELTGDILDLGSGSGRASHERMIAYKEPYTLTRTDYHRMGPGTVKLDLEDSFKLENKYDVVTCFNVLEHVYDYCNVLKESLKVLKPGGLFIATTPFLVRYHPTPEDYWRFSETALKRLLDEEGYTDIKVTGLGYGPFSCAQWVNIYPKVLRAYIHLMHIALDNILLRAKPYHKDRYPIAFLVMARRGD